MVAADPEYAVGEHRNSDCIYDSARVFGHREQSHVGRAQ
jgi:hypothetical protein